MTCGICGKTLVQRQTKYCCKRCSGLAASQKWDGRMTGKLADPAWRKARSQKAGAAAAKRTRQVQRERVAGMTAVQAWHNGYVTARQQLARYYQKWATQKVAELCAVKAS